jgi:hypothetical protein
MQSDKFSESVACSAVCDNARLPCSAKVTPVCKSIETSFSLETSLETLYFAKFPDVWLLLSVCIRRSPVIIVNQLVGSRETSQNRHTIVRHITFVLSNLQRSGTPTRRQHEPFDFGATTAAWIINWCNVGR